MDLEAKDNLMERILLDLKTVLENIKSIDEFDLLPVPESVQNKSPVVCVVNKFALENWCIKPLYVYVYNNFFYWRNKKKKIDSETIWLWTCAILLINPEIETVWNARKELLIESPMGLRLEDELKFSEIVLSRVPKSSPVFAHRKWIWLKKREEFINSDTIKQELFVCLRMADLYANNYYAWSHRSWIMQEILKTCLKCVKEELTQTEKWVSTHVSDHSGFHYRQFLLSCYRTSSADSSTSCVLHRTTQIESANYDSNDKSALQQWVESIHKEMLLLSHLQNTYPGHETLWYHRRYLLQEIKMANIGAETGLSSAQHESLGDSLQNKRLKSELDSTETWDGANEQEFLNRCCNASTNQNWERTLITRHVKWLNNVLQWPLSVCLS